ncbi:MAG: nucleotidyltransferase family protein [Elusimicrobia bacterium]|nr:nucleotidyltransferase family protein [Candidatus Liberimonas magnetica]
MNLAKPLNKAILTRNLLILHQLKELAWVLENEGVPVILLKGAALINTVEDYASERIMDDIDLLLKPGDMIKTRNTLNSLGYSAFNSDSGSFCSNSKPAYIDITDNLWYLSKKEIEQLWQNSKNHEISPMVYHLPPDEFYIHVLAHAALHHGIKETAWLRDLEVIKIKWGKEINPQILDNKLIKYGLSSVSDVFLGQPAGEGFSPLVYSWFLKRSIPLKGHILRFLFLPLNKKFSYLTRTLFPSTDFLTYRYNLKNAFQILIFRIIRPVLLFFKLLQMPFNYCLHMYRENAK